MLACTLWLGGTILANSAAAGPGHWWSETLLALRDQARDRGELYHEPATDYELPAFVHQSGVAAGASLKLSAAMCAVVAVLLLARRSDRRAGYALAVLAVVELVFFAWPLRDSFDLDDVRTPQLEKHLASQPRDARFVNEINPNEVMTIDALNVFGYDPGVPRRYAELFSYAARTPLAEVTQHVIYEPQPQIPSIYRIARSHFRMVAIEASEQWSYETVPMPGPLDRLVLLTDYQVAATREEVFRFMSRETFDPTRTVILENSPDPAPGSPLGASGQPIGSANVVDESTDHLTIEAELQSPAILLVTDAYDADWRVVPLAESPQAQYEIMPADGAFRAIPLAAGRHQIRLEYAPASLKYGAVVTALSLGAWIALAVQCRRRRLVNFRSESVRG